MTESVQNEKDLFEAARNLTDPIERKTFLDEKCKRDSRLRSRLERLLAAQDNADKFFDLPRSSDLLGESTATPALAGAPSLSDRETVRLAGTNARIGRYQLLERLGEGGCGVVYLAEQFEPVLRRVAFKIIRLGMDTESVIARFEAERQALALMDHPNIAHVLDAGATETGRPYFVMEWVRGVKITQFCDENQFDTRQRLKLFIQVCHAIQHAHQKGVIHRDIKPSNILVALHDKVAVPKVIDFGIAKATEGRLSDNTVFTAFDQFIGTPAYMSPEQADRSGLDVDTRSDIYSLGVLLYELLTGRTPFDSKQLIKSGVDAIRRTLRENEPPPPSTLLTSLSNTELTTLASQRHAEPPKLILELRGDLDWIVMKTLEKDRQRRYETANGLAMDVERYLKNEPVVARPPSRLYRFQKMVQRNTGTFAAVAAVSAALIVGLGTSTVMLFKEREARERAVEAEHKQIRLREEADRLRQQAEARQKLSQAITYLSWERYSDADALVSEIEIIERKLEYPTLFRALGDWHGSHGRWREAADRFAVLMQVVQPDDWDTATLDYLRQGPALLEGGDVTGYERFRESAIAHYSGTSNPIAAERVVKVSLLLPANAGLLRSLKPLGEVAAASLENDGARYAGESLAAWRAFSLALWELRRGNYEKSLVWCEQSVGYQNSTPPRAISNRLVAAMARQGLGQPSQMRLDLAECRKLIDDQLAKGLQVGNGSDGFWFDWVFARILLREAEALAGQMRIEAASENAATTSK